MYADPALASKPALLEQRGGAFYSEAATRLVASLATGDGAIHVVDMRNGGDARRARRRRRGRGAGARRRAGRRCRCPSARWRPSCSGSSQHVAAYERLAVEAAVTGEPPRRAAGAARASARSGNGAWSSRSSRGCSARPPGRDRDRRDRPRRRRRQLEDRPRAGRAPTASLLGHGARAAELAAPHRARRLPARARGPARRGDGGRGPAGRAAGRRGRPRAARRRRPAGRGARAAGRRSARAAGRCARRSSNDTFAILRAGTERGWGVAVVCGAGINCVGRGARRPPRALPRARDDHRRLGRRPRRRAGGGLRRRRAARTGAGRRTTLEARVPAHFGLRHAARARPRRSTSGGSRRGACSSSRRWSSPRPSATRWRPRSSIASPPRSSRSPAWR